MVIYVYITYHYSKGIMRWVRLISRAHTSNSKLLNNIEKHQVIPILRT